MQYEQLFNFGAVTVYNNISYKISAGKVKNREKTLKACFPRLFIHFTKVLKHYHEWLRNYWTDFYGFVLI